MASYIIPGLAEYIDVVWAPLAGFLMTKMYKGRVGKVAGILTFVEEIIPFTDVIPSFTITWVYTYWIKSDNRPNIAVWHPGVVPDPFRLGALGIGFLWDRVEA